jgi:hypothetical protein
MAWRPEISLLTTGPLVAMRPRQDSRGDYLELISKCGRYYGVRRPLSPIPLNVWGVGYRLVAAAG